METIELDRVKLPTGVTITDETTLLVRDRVEFNSDNGPNPSFEPGDTIEIHGIEWVGGNESEVLVFFNADAPIDSLAFGDGTEFGLAGLVQKGKFVIIDP